MEVGHVLAALNDRRTGALVAADQSRWVPVCDVNDMQDGFAKIKLLADGNRVAVYLTQGKLSAISNACAHQNGPLGEGRVINCLVTCPWHGFQYDVTSGRSPAPFTEKVPTYNLKLDGSQVFVDPNANPPGTYVEPVSVPSSMKETS